MDPRREPSEERGSPSIQQHLRGLIEGALEGLRSDQILARDPASKIEIDRTDRPEHGDFFTNAAMQLSGEFGIKPRQLAERIIERLPESEDVAKVEVAGPGFINFFLSDSWMYRNIVEIATSREAYGKSEMGAGKRVLVEFVSANPTGPLHVGSGRNAAYGDSLANLLAAAGYFVEREYYLNDTGQQMDRFTKSLEARYLQASGHKAEVPEDGYHGDYLVELGKQLYEEEGLGLIGRAEDIGEWGLNKMIEAHRATMERFRVRFDNWFSERSLHKAGKVSAAIDRMADLGLTYFADGALWFRAGEIGTTQDRVLVRSDEKKSPTYLAVDMAYLFDKISRGFDLALYVWGADHHGQIDDFLAAARAAGLENRAEVIMYQHVNLLRGGESVRMSRRAGEIVTLDELIDEVGVDATRFTFLLRSFNSAMDFDIEEVKAQTMENPVYYVQYQHARISSIIRYGAESGTKLGPVQEAELTRLKEPSEHELIRKLAEFPDMIETSAKQRAPYRLTAYAQSLATAFSVFYTNCRVITEDRKLTQARLWLSEATRQVLANTLGILGVTAPERMEKVS
jgi:arginyl-tRNA synthetase